jgi:hypothetical protein
VYQIILFCNSLAERRKQGTEVKQSTFAQKKKVKQSTLLRRLSLFRKQSTIQPMTGISRTQAKIFTRNPATRGAAREKTHQLKQKQRPRQQSNSAAVKSAGDL